MSSSADVSPAISPSATSLSGQHGPKFGTVIPKRIFVGGIAANTTETELRQFFSVYGEVKDTKIIADRAGVSKGYGFVTFENMEDAERVLKKESENLIFKERKLNIGPAIRKHVLPGTYDPNLPAGTVMFTNDVPYTFQNGMAIFHAPEVGAYQVHQPQQSFAPAMVMPRTSATMYIPQQYAAYQANSPPWAAPATAAAAAAQTPWHWTQPTLGQHVANNQGYVYATMHSTPELVYAQAPTQNYQHPDVGDTLLLDDGSVEVIPGHYPL